MLLGTACSISATRIANRTVSSEGTARLRRPVTSAIAVYASCATRRGFHPMRAPAAARPEAMVVSESWKRGSWYMKKKQGIPLSGKSSHCRCMFSRSG